jgi:hypothetical protein
MPVPVSREDVRPEAQFDLERGVIWLHLSEAQAEDVASGYVPRSIKCVLRELLDYAEEDIRRAERPVSTKKKHVTEPVTKSRAR